jgi:hypothetical protein
MIFKILLPKNLSKNIGVFCSDYCQFFEKNDHNIGFGEKHQFFEENWHKSPKIMIITLAPD